MRSRNDSSNPRMIELIPTMAVMPITTPRTVSAERILLAQIVAMAMLMVSVMSATLPSDPIPALAPQSGRAWPP